MKVTLKRQRTFYAEQWKVSASRRYLKYYYYHYFVIPEGYFNSHVSQQAVRSEWTFIPYKMDPESNQLARPLDMRGGHQMCIDSNTGQLYLYGGWGGSKELGDFWKFNTRNNHWTCLSQDTSREVCLVILCYFISSVCVVIQ